MNRMLFNFRLFSKVLYSFLVLLLIILIGTIGYILVEDWSIIDSFYQTIITVSTVGFGEVHELSNLGKLFTAFLIITSFGTFAYALTSITSYIVSGDYRLYFKEFKYMKKINQMNNHVIVCGYGRVGSTAIETLGEHNNNCLLIEKDDKVVEQFRMKTSYDCIKGDATQDELLLKSGIMNAKALITTLPSDSDNLFVVLTARELNKDIKIISRASKSSSVKKLKIAGADNVIMPDSLGGSHMAQLVATPDVLEFIDEISIEGENKINLESIDFNEIPSDFQYKSIGDLKKQFKVCNLIGFKDPSGNFIINPKDETEIVPSCKILVLGTTDEIKKLNQIFGI
ncbi:MAG: potassium channel protein [Crocinitomicaceae bacterium]|nr:potassium channel protein [Crocinitomicaceae bacterium]